MNGTSALLMIFIFLGLLWLIDIPKRPKEQVCSLEGCKQPSYGIVSNKPFCHQHIRM
jgi:hypothetical protein